MAELLEEADSTTIEDVYTDGLAYVLDQPEFAGGHALRPVLEVLQHVDFLEQLLPVVTRQGGIHVIIGRENPNDAMRRCHSSSPRMGRRAAHWACSECWARPGWPIRAPFPPSASCRVS